ncbi:NAD(P)-dependent alcohol dehydrogenase [Dysgonomonas sp. ZJ709]|uniref:NAD(P)-dependent alcohol dehydrogenase n=1 Tax=Dysgonomonas sp. ZJ709 TaxID=2709797 RepID=UPI0013ECE434|nr:NAD(P)-dependent alcohol dehydrogenase [Dysgonomonas sp. ZJ709]
MKKTILNSFMFLMLVLASVYAQGQTTLSHEGHIHTKAYAVKEEKGNLVPYDFDRRAVGDDDILIDILYSGICHSDIHTVKGDWGSISYPCVPGHEIVGRVSKIGKNVSKFKIGDIAGVGCMVNSCGKCHYCESGEEQYCTGGATYTYNSREGDGYTQGGYSTNIVVKESFALKVPQNVPLARVAPLLCAGITTYSPLRYNHVKKGDKVAVAGFGGLGHMALKYALAMGAEVTVFDITEDKRQAALDMGARQYVNTTNPKEMEGFNSSFNLILSTIPFNFQVESYLSMLEVDGTMVLIGVQPMDQIPSVNTMALWGRRKIYHSLIGGINETQEMLDYSIKNNIYPQIEIIPMQQVNEAYENVLDGKVQFRYVIDMQSIK